MSLKLLAILFTVACPLNLVSPDIPVYAEKTMLKPQAAGFYRTRVGDLEVTALSDGTNKRSVEQQFQLLQGDKEKIKDLLVRAYPDGQIESSVTVFLIDTGSKRVLFDAGNGRMGSPTMGNAMDNLRAAGYQPEDIDEIYLTHMHVDHIGGLISGAERTFPNATVFANKTEAEYWLSEINPDAAPDTAKRTYQAAKTAITPYIDAGRFKTFEGGAALLQGIRAESLFGHTPGHTAYFIESKGKTLVLWGDVIHVAAVQFEKPSVAISFDSHNTEAVKSRQQILAKAANNGWLIGGVHLSFPSFGHIRANAGEGYTFLPLGTSE